MEIKIIYTNNNSETFENTCTTFTEAIDYISGLQIIEIKEQHERNLRLDDPAEADEDCIEEEKGDTTQEGDDPSPDA
jgi:hypothetical protein